MKKLHLFAALIGVLLSCSKEDQNLAEEHKIPINISVGQSTRANDETFESNDEIGLYVVNYIDEIAGELTASGNHVDNMRFKFIGGSWIPDNEVYWKDKNTSADFYAYYPYSGDVTSIVSHPFSVKLDQSSSEDFWASDFLWGKAINVCPDEKTVSIQTNHSLSRILIDIKPGSGFTDDSWISADKSVKICDVLTSATIDLSTGIATATGSKSEIVPLSTSVSGTTSSYQAMMIPQVVADKSKLVVITVDGVDYVYRKGFSFGANTQYKFSVTVNKSGNSVDVTIGEWIVDEFCNQGSAIEESESAVETIANNQIWYTTTDGKALGKTSTSIVSDAYVDGKGVIVFKADLTVIESEMFSANTTLANITLPNSVTDIEKDAFSNCDKLVIVHLSNQLKKISDGVFSGCLSLESIALPESLTSLGDKVFSGCSKLSIVQLESVLPPLIKSNTFYNTPSFLKIIVPNDYVGNYKNGAIWSNLADKIETAPADN